MDEVFSMSYSADNSYVRDNAILFKSITTDQAFYSVGLSAFGTTTEINLALQIDLVRDVGAEGSALFSLGSITDGNYGNTIRSSSYSGKSVQTYLLSKTVSTGLSDILRKLDIVYAYTPEHPLRERTVALINPVLTLANGFDLENASIEQKLNYAERAISDLESIILVISGMEDEIKGRREALVSDFERLCGYLIISRNRLSARLD